jgi:hypothetical protein
MRFCCLITETVRDPAERETNRGRASPGVIMLSKISFFAVLSALSLYTTAAAVEERVRVPVREWTYQKPVIGENGKPGWSEDPSHVQHLATEEGALRVEVVGPTRKGTLVQHGGAIAVLAKVVPAGLPMRISFRARSMEGARFLSVNRHWGGSRPWNAVQLGRDWQEFSLTRTSSRFSTRRLSFNLKEARRPRLSPHSEGIFEIKEVRIECPGRKGALVPMERGKNIRANTFPLTIPYEIEEPGQVSVGVYDGRGRLLRTLETGVQREAGRHALRWDGVDRYGRPARPGTYHWRLLRTPGFRAKYLLTLGINPDSKPWHLWPGTHSGPYAVATDEEGALYVASAITEHTPFLIKQTLDGTERLWENFGRGHGYGYLRLASAIAMGTSGRRVLTLGRHGRVTVWQKGARAGGRVKTFDVVTPAQSDRIEARIREKPDRPTTERDWRGAADMTVGDGWFAVSLRDQNMVRFVDIDTDDVLRREKRRGKAMYGGRIRDARLPHPLGVAAGPDKKLFVLSRGRILELSVDEDQHSVLVTHNVLDHAQRMDYLPEREQFLLTTGQPRPNQVVRLSPDGEILATYGREGGRRWGRYEPEDFYRIRDVCADGRGGFVVTEEGHQTLRRTAHFNQDGALVNEWYGAPPWGTYSALHPADPTRAMVQIGHGLVAWAKIDYSERDWEVTATYRQPETEGMFPGFGGGKIWGLRRQGDELFLVNLGGDGHNTAPAVYRIQPESLRPVPFAAAGVLSRKNFPGNAPAWWMEAFRRLPEKERPERRSLRGFSWSDADADGEIEGDEIRLGPPVGYTPRRRHVHMDENWNITYGRDDGKSLWGTLANEAEDGSPPLWRWEKARRVKSEYPSTYAGNVHDFSAAGVWRDEAGGMYQLMFGNRARPFRHGRYWPASTIGTARFIKWNPKGRLEWEVGNHGTTIHLPPGRFQCPRRILGGAHDCVVAQDRTIRLAMVWSRDGLYAGSFRDGRVDDGLPDFVYDMSRVYYQPGLILGDNTGNTMFKTPEGEIIWGPAGCAGSPLYGIHGWDGWSRQVGEIELSKSPRAARREGSGLKGQYYGQPLRPDTSLNVEEESIDEDSLLEIDEKQEKVKEDDPFGGEPVLSRIDPRIRFGSRTFPPGNRIKHPRPWTEKDGPLERMFNIGRFAVRWTGWLEPLFSEPYLFIIEHQQGDGVRLWIGDREVIQSRRDPDKNPGKLKTVLQRSPTLEMKAGRAVPIKVEYRASGPAPHLHLKWESLYTQEQRYIPPHALYSTPPQ